MNIRKLLLWSCAVILVIFIGWWIWQKLSTPLPGELVASLGRNHVSDGTQVEYNSNPPTSGPHYEEWTRAGVYNKPFSDGHLVHSLEHGYIIISYNCTNKTSAHEESLDVSPSAEASPSVEEDCKKLISQLTEIYEKEGKKKIIVLPRPSLDRRIALTAWTRIDKFNEFDEARTKKFIETFRDRGPEKTIE